MIAPSTVEKNFEESHNDLDIHDSCFSENDEEISISESEDESDDLFIPEDCFSLLFNKNIQTLLEMFQSYLIGFDNLRKGAPASRTSRTVSDVRRFFQIVGTNQDIVTVLNIETVRESYLSKLQIKELKAGTIKKYSFSLKDSCTFLILDKTALRISGCKASE